MGLGFSIPLNTYGPSLARPLSLRNALRRMRATDRSEEIDMGLIALQIGATVALLIGHLTIVIRNREFGSR